jgi:hypothetical protein
VSTLVSRRLARLVAAATLPPRALLRLCATAAALRLYGFPRLVALARASASRPDRLPTAQELARARRYAGWLRALGSGWPLRAHCLPRALALHFWLRREGIPSEVCIGVRKEDGALRAHAWVELGGLVVDDLPLAVAPFRPLRGGAGPLSSPNWSAVAR